MSTDAITDIFQEINRGAMLPEQMLIIHAYTCTYSSSTILIIIKRLTNIIMHIQDTYCNLQLYVQCSLDRIIPSQLGCLDNHCLDNTRRCGWKSCSSLYWQRFKVLKHRIQSRHIVRLQFKPMVYPTYSLLSA